MGVSIYMFTTFVLVRHTFCKYICAAGLMQTLFGWISPVSLGVRFRTQERQRCTDCKRCEQVCFMDVRPRAKQWDINCVNCGECINVCRDELGGDGLFDFKQGGGRAMRPPAPKDLTPGCPPHLKGLS